LPNDIIYIRGTNFKQLKNEKASALPQNDLRDTHNNFLNLFGPKNFQQVPANQIFLTQLHISKKFAISRLKFLPVMKAVFKKRQRDIIVPFCNNA